jgi:hypothetical protein
LSFFSRTEDEICEVGDTLYFSPEYRFSDLDFDEPEAIAKAFRSRVEGFYLEPAARLIGTKDAFAAGLVICAGVEFIAAAWGKQGPHDWLQRNLPGFASDPSLASSFWRQFRDGLAHEGRIKSFGQFSLESPRMLAKVDDALVVNPRLLLNAVMEAFRKQCDEISASRRKVLAQNLRHHFEAEVRATRK